MMATASPRQTGRPRSLPAPLS